MKKKTPKKPKAGTTPMDQLTANYEEFIKGKETVKNGKKAFTKALKHSTKPSEK